MACRKSITVSRCVRSTQQLLLHNSRLELVCLYSVLILLSISKPPICEASHLLRQALIGGANDLLQQVDRRSRLKLPHAAMNLCCRDLESRADTTASHVVEKETQALSPTCACMFCCSGPEPFYFRAILHESTLNLYGHHGSAVSSCDKNWKGGPPRHPYLIISRMHLMCGWQVRVGTAL